MKGFATQIVRHILSRLNFSDRVCLFSAAARLASALRCAALRSIIAAAPRQLHQLQAEIGPHSSAIWPLAKMKLGLRPRAGIHLDVSTFFFAEKKV